MKARFHQKHNTAPKGSIGLQGSMPIQRVQGQARRSTTDPTGQVMGRGLALMQLDRRQQLCPSESSKYGDTVTT